MSDDLWHWPKLAKYLPPGDWIIRGGGAMRVGFYLQLPVADNDSE